MAYRDFYGTDGCVVDDYQHYEAKQVIPHYVIWFLQDIRDNRVTLARGEV